MSTNFIWKPQPSKPGKGPVFLAPSGNRSVPTITAGGKTYTGRFVNDVPGEFAQWEFPRELIGMNDLQVSHGGKTGTIASGGTSYEGGDIGSWDARAKGSVGSGGNFPGQFNPSQVGQFGFAPGYLGGEFPSPSLANYKNIKTAPYKFTDPFDFAAKFGELNRSEIGKNYEQSKNMGLDALSTELKGLQGYAPAAAALQRGLTSIDNQFNQQQRTQQADTALPGVRGQLNSQGTRAETYAGGSLGSAIDDRAYDVSARSRAADMASSGGFGAESSAARKTSDLMSAEQKLNLSKYGDQLLTQNIGTKANLLLAPTEYANAGSQIKVTPSVDAATRGSQFLGEINQGTLLSPGAAFQGNIQQNQFSTSLESNTRQFNASNQLQTSMFNAGVQNTFSMAKFGYDVGFAGSVAGAAQTDANTAIKLEQQQKAFDIFGENKSDTQTSNTIGSIVGALTGAAEIFSNLGKNKDGSQGGNTDTSGVTPVDAPLASDAGDSNWKDTPTSSQIDSGDNVGGDGQASPPPISSGVDYGGSSEYSPTPMPQMPPYASPPSTENYSLGESDSVPQTFNFARMAKIAPAEAVQMKSFVKTVGTGGAPRIAAPEARAMAASSSHALSVAGVSSTPKPGYVQTGYNPTGAPVYSSQSLLNNPSTDSGADIVRSLHQTLTPFEQFSKQDANNLNKVSSLADPEFIKALDSMAASKDPKAFTKLLNKAVKHVTKNDKKTSSKKEPSKKAA